MTLLLLFLAYAISLSIALERAGLRSVTAIPAARPVAPGARVLIVGATGGTGKQLVTQALARGYAVTAFVREPARLPIQDPRLQVIRGDVLDAAAVDRAVRGQDAVISALGHRRFLGPSRILSEGTHNIVQAMDAHGARRFVCETSLGIGDAAGRLGLLYTLFVIPVVLPFYFWDKTRQERVIGSSGLDWVIVRPGALTDSPARGVYRQGRYVGNFVTTVRISRADVAAFMLAQLEGDTRLGTAVGVCW